MKARFLLLRGSVSAALLASLVYGYPRQQKEPEIKIKLKSDLVQFDVLVTNKFGTPITDLEKEDFELVESGKAQEISFFSFVNPSEPQPEYSTDPRRAADALPARNSADRTIFLILDPNFIGRGRYAVVYRALSKLINEELLPGDQVAIFTTNGKLPGFQQATRDKKALTIAIRALFGNPAPLEDIDPKLLGLQPPEELIITAKSIPKPHDSLKNLINILKIVSNVSGPKIALFISNNASLSVDLAERPRAVGPESENVHLEGLFLELNKAIEDVRRHDTIIYTIDPRGIHPGGPTMGQRRGTGGLLQSSGEVSASVSSNEAFGVLDLVDCGCMRKGLPLNAPYYMLAYYPADLGDTEKLKKVKIQVRGQPQLQVHATGFLWPASGSKNDSPKDSDRPAPDVSKKQLLSKALAAVTPSHELEVAIDNASVVTDASSGRDVAKMEIRINPATLSLKTESGDRLASFEVAGVAFDVNGKQIDRFSKEYNPRLNPEQFSKVTKDGLILSEELSVKRPGLFSLRVVVIDNETNRLGSSSAEWVRAQ